MLIIPCVIYTLCTAHRLPVPDEARAPTPRYGRGFRHVTWPGKMASNCGEESGAEEVGQDVVVT